MAEFHMIGIKTVCKKIKDRCPHVFGRETANTKEEAHVIWNRVKKEQKLRKKKKNIYIINIYILKSMI